MNEQIELLREIRDLLKVVAEPALAKRDEGLRGLLLKNVGKSKLKAKAVLLMDGARNQTAIRAEAEIDQGDLSRLVRNLREAALIGSDDKHPKLAIRIPHGFFDTREEEKDG